VKAFTFLRSKGKTISRRIYIILLLVLAVYTLLAVFQPGGFIAYALPSACWTLLAITTIWIGGPQKILQWFNKQAIIAAAIVDIIQILILINTGLFTGFGKSPYSFTPIGITINIIYVYTALLGTELTRAYLIKNFSHKKPILTIGLIAILYTFILTPVAGFTTLVNPTTIIMFLSSVLLPLLAENLLASYLTHLGGPLAALAYLAPLKAFYWFSPILPDFPWHVEALIGIMAPTIGFLIITFTTTSTYNPTMISTQSLSTPKPFNPKQDENEQKQKNRTAKKTNKKFTPLFLSILITFSLCTLAYSYWTDAIDISGTVTFIKRENTNLDFSLTPDPAYICQTIIMIGNLTNELNHPINNTEVDVFVNGKSVGSLFTNSSGWFTASAKMYTAGTFIVKVIFDGSEIYKPSNHTETLTVQKMNTTVSFTLSPNPATVGQTITMLGNLTDINNNLIGNAPLEVYVKTCTGPWQYMGTIFTNSSGWFKATGKIPFAGTYQVAVLYRGSYKYNLSYHIETFTINLP